MELKSIINDIKQPLNGHPHYKDVPLGDAEIQEVGELILDKYREFLPDDGNKPDCPRCPKKNG